MATEPTHPPARPLQRAKLLHKQQQWQAAIAAYQEILKQHPGHWKARYYYGLCLFDSHQTEAAIEQLEALLRKWPEHVRCMNTLAMAYYRLQALSKAKVLLNQAIKLQPKFALAHFNLGLLLLQQGDYAQGWIEYDWRWQTRQFTPIVTPKPLWQGQDISQQHLLVHSEQGNGDHLQFMRFLPMVAERCKRLLYLGPGNLAALAAEIHGVDRVLGLEDIKSCRFDVYCPLMSLPGCMDITLDNLPAPSRYLRIPADVDVAQLGGKIKVGIAWAGSDTHKSDRFRSLKLEQLQPLFELQDVDFFSLQMPLRPEEKALLAKYRITDLEEQLPGYDKTAALVDQLDLVISVDTAIAHLAGALGKPVWIILGEHPDWRWLLNRNDSPWYPTATLFRQTEFKSRDKLINRLKQALVQYFDSK